jgi:hypothetical protein
MKKTITLFVMLTFSTATYAQTALETKTKELADAQAAVAAAKAKADGIAKEVAALTLPVCWTKGGFGALNFNSLGLTNWAAGGVSANSVTALGNIFRNYKKDKVEWLNNLDLAYGLIKNDGETFRKNEDKIDLTTKANYGITEKLSYSALINFKSQFAPGFDFSDPTIADNVRPEVSKFLAPAFITASLGLNYSFTDYFSVFVSPATGKFTIVNDKSVASQHAYIPNTINSAGVKFYDSTFRAEFGALINARFKKDITKKINFTSTLGLFNNFTDDNNSNRKNVDVNWETMINMKLTDYIGVSLYTNVIHDNDIAVPLFDANNTAAGTGIRTQFKRLLGVGFSYKF